MLQSVGSQRADITEQPNNLRLEETKDRISYRASA